MKVLLDTCILSEIRHPRGSQETKRIVNSFEDEDLFLSALTLGEIAKGTTLLSESPKKHELQQWLNGLEYQFGDRILPVDGDVALIWGEVVARAKIKGITIPACDGLIAATALNYGLHILTHNIKHFEETGALLLDPGDHHQSL